MFKGLNNYLRSNLLYTCARFFEVEKTFEEWIAVNWFQVGSFLLLKVKETFLLNNVKRNFLDDV